MSYNKIISVSVKVRIELDIEKYIENILSSDSTSIAGAMDKLNQALIESNPHIQERAFHEIKIPFIKKWAIFPGEAVKEINKKKNKQMNWFVKLPMTQTQLLKLIDNSKGRTLGIIYDGHGKAYLHLIEGKNQIEVPAISEVYGRSRGNLWGVEPTAKDITIAKEYSTSFLLSKMDDRIEMSLKQSGDDDFRVLSENNIIAALKQLGLIK